MNFFEFVTFDDQNVASSSPPSTTPTRNPVLTPAHQRQLLFRRRLQQQRLATSNMMQANRNIQQRIQHQNRSDPSSSDDNAPSQPIINRLATSLNISLNKPMTPSSLSKDYFELKMLSSPPSSTSSNDTNRRLLIQHDDSLKTTSTMSPNTTISSDHDTLETTLSITHNDKSMDQSITYRRTRSYHEKGQLMQECRTHARKIIFFCTSISWL